MLLAFYCAFLLAGPIHLLTHDHAPQIVTASTEEGGKAAEAPTCSCTHCHASAKKAKPVGTRDAQPTWRQVPRGDECGCSGPCSLCETLFQTFVRTDAPASVAPVFAPRARASESATSVLAQSQRRLHGARAPPRSSESIPTTV